MHPNRRKKKRPNYGIRTVEVTRGPNGFGFTISGQQPCILSCIVKDSPADHAGLRAGDFLISVNDVSVSKTTHDSVVNLIGSCIAPIKMTIAENYYSDSSDEELEVARMITCRKTKHKPRPSRTHRFENRKANNGLFRTSSCEKYSLKFSNSTKESLNPLNIPNNTDNRPDARDYKALVAYPRGIEMTSQFTTDDHLKELSLDDQCGPIEYKALVGYLGTIEMPKQLSPNTRLQTVCHCIRKLRQEKRTPTAVLMTVLPTCLTLKNASNHILAIYPTNRVVYVGSSRDKDSRYFGLVTSVICDISPKESVEERARDLNIKKSNADIGISNSCHIFVTDSKLIDHNVHIQKAEAFNIICSEDPISGYCLEFPKDSIYIVSLIQSMYKLQCEIQNIKSNIIESGALPLVANSPQPSASSNSDSGIGFRDDFNTISDRIVLVEFPARDLGFVGEYENKETLNSEECQNGEILQNTYRDVEERFNLEFTKHKDLLKMVLNNEKKPLNNVQNLRAYESVIIKNSFAGAKSEYRKNNNEVEGRLNNFSNLDKLNFKPSINRLERNVSPSSFTSSDDNTKTNEIGNILNNNETKWDSFHDQDNGSRLYFNQQEDLSNCQNKPIAVPNELSIERSNEFISFISNSEDFEFKRSVDNFSMCSSKSLEFGNVMSVFKTPSTVFFERKTKQVTKIATSCDNLDKCGVGEGKASLRTNELKPNYSYEHLNNFDFGEHIEYGSLKELAFMDRNCKRSRHIARSEPDVRIRSEKASKNCMNESDGHVSKGNGQECAAQGWATSFERLLEDPQGVEAFAEFLKKEFSSENIDFWISVERFRQLSNGPEKRAEARRIYQQHVCVGAPEAVNVDAQGRQCAEQALKEAPSNIFDQAQKQVLNLMKFDSYPRFLKSDLYKLCLPTPSNAMTPIKLKKSLSNAEDRRRRSLLPWHRKSRSKSKDRFDNCETPAPRLGEGNSKNEIHNSKSSLTSLDLAMCNNLQNLKDDAEILSSTVLCRVSLGNCSTTVVQIKPNESIDDLVKRLLEKRGLNYSSFEVFTDRHTRPVDVNEVSAILAGCEVIIQQRVVFKLDLPNHKTVSVKSKATKMIVEVLKPILHKYDFTVDQVKVVNPKDPGCIIDIRQPITSINGLKLQVQLIDKRTSNMSEPKFANLQKANKLVEITNQVFEGILQDKAENSRQKAKSDKCSVKSEDLGSEQSSSYLGKFLCRDQQEWKKKSLIPRSKILVRSTPKTPELNHLKDKPLITKLKAGVIKQNVSPSSESECRKLVEGLTRAQKNRLDDQRGTEINFELPDFLKDKENERKLKKSTMYFVTEDKNHLLNNTVDPTSPLSSPAKNMKFEASVPYENQNIRTDPGKKDSPVNTPSKQTKLNNLVFSPTFSVQTIDFRSSQSSSMKITPSSSPTKEKIRVEPPPLPPKPKILPLKPPNWGQNEFGKKEVTHNQNNKLFLEQPSSSFV